MRGSHKLPVIPDILSLLAIVALVTVVYLCSLPQTFHSLSHRKDEAVSLLTKAQDDIVREGALFSALLAAGDKESRDRLRQDLRDNERGFHDVTIEVADKLPEAKREIEDLVREFDRMAETGWQAEAAARSAGPADAQAVMQGRFLPALNNLRDRTQAISHNLHQQDTRLRLPDPNPAFDKVLLHFI